MSKLHPASVAAARILRNNNLNFTRSGALSFRILSDEYNENPLYVDVRCSHHSDNLAKFDICFLYSEHSEYKKAEILNNFEFTW